MGNFPGGQRSAEPHRLSLERKLSAQLTDEVAAYLFSKPAAVPKRTPAAFHAPRESKIENGTPMCYTINASAAFMKQVQAAHHKIKQRS